VKFGDAAAAGPGFPLARNELPFDLSFSVVRRRAGADRKQGSRLFHRRHDARRKARIDSATSAGVESQPDPGPGKQKRFVAEIDQ